MRVKRTQNFIVPSWQHCDEHVTTLHVKKMEELVLSNCCMTVRDLADAGGISKAPVIAILEFILGLKRIKLRLMQGNSFEMIEEIQRESVENTLK